MDVNSATTTSTPSTPIPLYVLKESEDKGRYYEAAQDIKVGQQVLTEEAYALAPSYEFMHQVCFNCLKPFAATGNGRLMCKQTGMYFCSKECLESEIHTLEKDHIKNLFDIAMRTRVDFSLILLVFRVMIHSIMERATTLTTSGTSNNDDDDDNNNNNNASTTTKRQAKERFSSILNLVSHRDKFPAQHISLFKACASDMIAPLRKVAAAHQKAKNIDAAALHGKSLLPSADDIIDVFCIINVNSHGIGAEDAHTDSGLGLFAKCSLLSHSCSPNCAFSTVKGRIAVRAVEPIHKGQEITISYVDLFIPTKQRQERLAETKYFTCRCPRCVDPTENGRYLSAFKCDICSTGYFVPSVSTSTSTSTTATTTTTTTKTKTQAATPSLSSSSSSWKCDQCGAVPKSNLDALEEKLAGAYENAKDFFDSIPHVDQRAINKFASVIKEYGPKVHPNNFFVFLAELQLMNCLNSIGRIEEGLPHAQRVVQCAENVLPAHHIEKADYYGRLGTSCESLYFQYSSKTKSPTAAAKHRNDNSNDDDENNKKKAQQYLERAKEAYRTAFRQVCVCYGPDHPETRKAMDKVQMAGKSISAMTTTTTTTTTAAAATAAAAAAAVRK